MKRIYVICEGQTEEKFIKEFVSHEFALKNIFIFPHILGRIGHKGGRLDNQRLFDDIQTLLLNDRKSYCTTFFDFYALPAHFWGKTRISDGMSIQQKSDIICTSLDKHIAEKIKKDANRFIAYVQMYEFEGLLFSDVQKFGEKMALTSKIQNELQKIRDSFETPEHINDNQHTAPSKRILKLIKGYQKPVHGLAIAKAIGLPIMRRECSIFNQWLTKLEALPSIS